MEYPVVYNKEGGEIEGMKRMNKLLVPVDLSSRSLCAARYARELAAELGSEVLFLHVLQSGWPLTGERKEIREQIIQSSEGIRSAFLVREGLVGPAILDVARSEEPGAILMPTRGLGAASRLLGRSITAQVLRAAPCPVWSWRDDLAVSQGLPIRRVVCGLSLGPRAGVVLDWAAAIAGKLQAGLELVHASASLRPHPGYPCEGEWRAWVRQMATDEISALQAKAGTQAPVWLEPGRPANAIPAIAGRLRSELIVIGRNPAIRLLADLGAISYDVVRRASCPVVSV